jgi:hypothetical protein
MVGTHWLRFARRWLDERTVDVVIEPLVADWQHEVRASDRLTSIAVRFRGHLALARSVLACLLQQSRQPLPSGVAVKAWFIVEAFATLGVLLVMVIAAYTSDMSRAPLGVILPASLTLALPLAAVPLLVAMTRLRAVTPQVARWLAVRTALLLTLAMIPLAGWIAPQTHLGWRESLVGHELPHSLRQMTLTELVASNYGSSAALSAAKRHETNYRLSTILMPISLSVFGLAAARARRRASAAIGRAIGGATLWWITGAVLCVGALPAINVLLQATGFNTFPWTPLAPWGSHVALLLSSVTLARLRGEAEQIRVG